MSGNKKYEFNDGLENNVATTNKSKFKASRYGYRHQQCFIMFVCLSTAYSMRACIGVAIVGMNDSHYSDKPVINNAINNTILKTLFNSTDYFNKGNSTEINEDTRFKQSGEKNEQQYLNEAIDNYSSLNMSNNLNISKSADVNKNLLHKLLLIPPYPKTNWTKQTQDIVISSFFWGYMSLQIPAGQLVHKFGPRHLLVGALTINCFVSFCFPWAVLYGGWIFAVVCRLLQGMSQACIIPGMFGFFGKWAPLEERSRLVGFASGGQAIGTVLALPVTGFIAASPLGWPGIFRFFGILAGLVALLVHFMIFDDPSQHPRISVEERKHIQDDLGSTQGHDGKKQPVPWREILRCRALYGILIAHISQTWGQVTLFTEIPSFMDKVMGVNIKANGMLTALPFLLMWFSNFFFNWLIDWIIVKKYMTVTNARKFATILGNVPPAIGLVILAYAPKTVTIVESILIFICVFKIASHVGFMVTHIDIAPNFAGTMMSISNFVSNLVGSQAPLVAGLLLTDVSSEQDWRKVFLVAAGLYFFTNLVYLVLGSAERAPWNDPPPVDPECGSELETMIKKVKKEENGQSQSN